jgi:hypothetical protein
MAGEPVCVTFEFPSDEAKNWFLGQLSDGLGENEVRLEWPGGVPLYDAPLVRVRPDGDLWDHHLRMKAKYGDLR